MPDHVVREKALERVAIVTGGGRGLGRSMVLGLVRAGVPVIATAGRERSEIEAVAREAEESNAQASAVPLVADVTNTSDCEIIVDAAVKRFWPPGHSGEQRRPWHEVCQRFVYDRANPLLGDLAGGLAADYRHERQPAVSDGTNRSASDDQSWRGSMRRGFSPYGPSKAALESQTIIWSQDLQGTGATVNALLPGGATRTGMIPDSVSDQVRSNFLDPDIMTSSFRHSSG